MATRHEDCSQAARQYGDVPNKLRRKMRAASSWMRVVPILLAVSGLEAYAIFDVPFTWITGVSLLLVWVASFGLVRLLDSIDPILALLILWFAFVTALGSYSGGYELMMPRAATTPYWGYIGLRFLNVLVFVAATTLTAALIEEGRERQLRTTLVVAGGLIAFVAIYIYAAQIYGWPEPPRTRIGTGGGEQSTIFAYGFHRAMGTFREPSHLAEWLVTPFALSLASSGRVAAVSRLAMCVVLLLTGSLTGIVGLAIGLVCAVIWLMFAGAARAAAFRTLAVSLSKLFLATLVAYFGFVLLVRGYGEGHLGLLEQIYARIEPIFEESGVYSTNRDYVYEFLASTDISLTGVGVGNANILFASALGIEVMPSFLSLYINALLSGGVVGLLLLCAYIAMPIVRVITARGGHIEIGLASAVLAYFSWLVMLGVHAEELHIMFGVAVGYLVARVQVRRATPVVPALERRNDLGRTRLQTIRGGAGAEAAGSSRSGGTGRTPR